MQTLGLERYNSGAGVPTLNRNHLDTLEVAIHSVKEQFKVAAVLAAYDALIENNLRRVKILEEMAQNVYREWFVNFHFPGHRNVRIVDSELGKMPEGWRISTISRVCESLQDGDWIETKDQGGDDYRLLQVSNIGVGEFIEKGNFRFITQETFDRLHCTEIAIGDILISRMPKPTGRAWLVSEKPWRMITSVDVAIAKPKQGVAMFLLQFLNSADQLALVEQHQTGTTRPRIARRNLGALPVLLPPASLRDQFSDIVGDNYALGTNLRNKNDLLRSARDLLLPKLISGELDVSELDIEISEEAA
jgi:type I restriction enzyme S subunit